MLRVPMFPCYTVACTKNTFHLLIKVSYLDLVREFHDSFNSLLASDDNHLPMNFDLKTGRRSEPLTVPALAPPLSRGGLASCSSWE